MAKLSYISKSASPMTRTYKIEAEISNKDGEVFERDFQLICWFLFERFLHI